MKTFEEAMGLFCREHVLGSDAKSQVDSMMEEIDKRHSIAEEIAQSPIAAEFILQYVQNVPEYFGTMEAFALSLFVNGVLVGMEMERTDL